MIEKNTIEKVMAKFFENPTTEVHLRELSRQMKISMPTIISTTDKLSKEQLLQKKKNKFLTTVKANAENTRFVRLKRVFNIEQIYESGIVDELIKEYNHPQTIVLFGSYSRGEDIERSDIDIGVITNKKTNINTTQYEKKLKRKISIHEINLDKVSQEFKNNLCNGIILEGAI